MEHFSSTMRYTRKTVGNFLAVRKLSKMLRIYQSYLSSVRVSTTMCHGTAVYLPEKRGRHICQAKQALAQLINGTVIEILERFSRRSSAPPLQIRTREARGGAHQGFRFTRRNNLFKSSSSTRLDLLAPNPGMESQGENSTPYRAGSSFRESSKAANKWTNVLGIERGFPQRCSSFCRTYL